MSREILDCLKRERDICVKNVIHSQNTAFMFTPALTFAQWSVFKICALNAALRPVEEPLRHEAVQETKRSLNSKYKFRESVVIV